jgi:hypothetical protein
MWDNFDAACVFKYCRNLLIPLNSAGYSQLFIFPDVYPSLGSGLICQRLFESALAGGK